MKGMTMRRFTRPFYMILGGLVVLLLSGVAYATHETPDLETRVANIEATLGISYEHEEPTATDVPPTATPTEEPPVAANTWHPATDHEHGEPAPQWAEDWSMQRFGHGVIYGGDEATPHENAFKHRAFKGQVVPSNAGGEAYVRYHGQSNPLGRSAQFHSYELYYQDTAGGVSFFQGWADCGDPDTARFPRSQGDPGDRPAMLVVDQAAWDSGTARFEQWYCFGAGARLVELGVSIGNTTTIWHPGEQNNDPANMANWDVTGSDGNTRLVDFFLLERRYQGVTGEFCLTAMGQRATCGEPGALVQHIAPTLYDDMRVEFNVSRVSGQRQVNHPCSACSLPN